MPARYARLRRPARERLRGPDEGSGAPTDEHTWRRALRPRLTTDRAHAPFDAVYAGTGGVDGGDAHQRPDRACWADVQTFHDQGTPDVFVGDTGFTKATDSPIAPGTAGRYEDTGLRWSTSGCDGCPAVRILRLRHGSDSRSPRAAPHIELLFRGVRRRCRPVRQDRRALTFPGPRPSRP
ncbi:hypothetical protein [Streptomyces sp. ALI-76-A]|uniref:hypothetical protein n=1 Tax=Streptomyces sp. ALI-76-A TaxID=3025736 RepID=UPI00256F5EDD|nr:hypothetical protein [Streptomyces sp. ALI-76-A]MDL5202486.1 hypothetical protein [Streptomyces sp. ALI-76-A]